MADALLDPRRSMPTYAVRAPLVRWLREQAVEAHHALWCYRVLDVGCGAKPYEPLLSRYAASYVRVARWRARGRSSQDRSRISRSATGASTSSSATRCSSTATTRGRPSRSSAVLRLPAAACSCRPTESWPATLRRLTRRWTHAGLEKLFLDNGAWESVPVTPASGTTACLGMLLSMYFDLPFRHARLGAAALPLVVGINTVATGIDSRSVRLREPGPGTLFANFHVAARVPQ